MAIHNLINKLKEFSFFDTFKHVSTYFSGTVLVHLLGLISLPIFTNYLSPEEYGIANVYNSYIMIFVILLSFNLHWAIPRYFFEEEKTDFSSFLMSILIAVTVIFWTLSSITLWYSVELAKLMNIPSNLIKWLVLNAYLMIVYSFLMQILVSTKQSKKYVAVRVAWQYGKFGLTFLGLVYLSTRSYSFMFDGKEVTNIFMGKIVGEWIATLLIILYACKELYPYLSSKGMSFSHIKYALLYSIPLIPFSLSDFILTSFDQFYINSTIGNEEAGNYAFAYKIGLIYLGLGNALLNGSNPSYYEFMNKKDYKQVWQQVDSMTKLLILGGGFLILFAVDAGTLLSSNDAFLDALPIAPVIVGSYVFFGISSFANRGIYYIKKNSYLAAIVLTSGIINICLNVYLIPLYNNNYQIAAYTTLASYFIMMVLSIIVTTYILKLPPLPLGRILKYIVLLGIIIGINYTIGAPNVGMHFGWIAFKIVLLGLLGLSLFYNKIGLLFLNKPAIEKDILDGPEED